MPQRCTVCDAPARAEIDKALAAGAGTRDLARRFGLARSSVERHESNHLSARLVKAQERLDVREALDVIAQLRAINAAALGVLKDAREARDGELVLKAVDRVHRQVELQAKLLGDLDDRPQFNLTIAPEWLELRVVILNALSGHPQARQAVLQAISERAG